MSKKISVILLALVICLSAVVIPTSAYELGTSSEIAYEVKLDKEYYSAGETVTISLYLYGDESLQYDAGALVFGCHSDVFDQSENAAADVKASATIGETAGTFYTDFSTMTWTWQTNTTIYNNIVTNNTDEENELFDQFIKVVVKRQSTSNGTHENSSNTKLGYPGSDMNAESDAGIAFVSFQLKLRDDIADGTKINVGIPTGPMAKNYTYMSYFSDPGNSTTKPKTTAATSEVVFAEVTVGKPAVHECTPAEAVQENVVNATCGTDGSYDAVVYCSVCGEEISRTPTTVPATGEHVYAKEINRVEPTCTEDGYVVKACGCSDNVNITETLPATGHSETKVVTKPTCTEAGYTTYTCSACGNVRTADEVPAKGHSYREKVTAPTCTEPGYSTFTCPFCKDSYTGNPVEATGHNYESVVTAPTCTEDGYTTYTCSVCSDAYTSDVVPATGHNYEVTFVKQPSCAKPGSTTYTCSVCGDSYKEEIPSKNHTNEDGTSALVEIPAVPATCKNHGYTAGQKCTICNAQTIVPERVERIDHTWDAGVVTAPTYTSEGYTTYTCTVCSETKISDKVPALTPDTPDTPDTPATATKFAIREPAVTKLRYMDEMLLHTVMPSNAPEGAYVKWTVVEGDGYFRIMEDNGDGKLRITPQEEGWTTFRATLYDASGNVLATDEIEMFSRAHLFDKIGGIIRYIFGSNIKYEK